MQTGKYGEYAIMPQVECKIVMLALVEMSGDWKFDFLVQCSLE